MPRKFPQFQQNDLFSLADAFRKLDVDDKGYIDEATAIKATQASERQPYDVVRQALKEVELDSSRRVELEDYIGVRCHPPPLSLSSAHFPDNTLLTVTAHRQGPRALLQRAAWRHPRVVARRRHLTTDRRPPVQGQHQ